MMVRRKMTTLGLIGFLTIGQIGAMEVPNKNTVNRIAEVIQQLGLQGNSPENKEIILDALEDVMVTDMEISEAFENVQSQGKQMPQEQNASGKLGRELTATEKENAYKMWLMQQAMEKGADQGMLPEVPKDVKNVIGGKLHELSANPVLEGELKYEGAPNPFKIRDLVKENGNLDLDKVDESGRKIFGNASKYVLITTNPEQFFNTVEYSQRLLILIAPKFLIQEKIESSAKPFKPIMSNWKEDQAPIGIFCRVEWSDLEEFEYITSIDMRYITRYSLYDLLAHKSVRNTNSFFRLFNHVPDLKYFKFILNKN